MPSLAFKLGGFLNLEKSILQCVNMTAVGALKKKMHLQEGRNNNGLNTLWL